MHVVLLLQCKYEAGLHEKCRFCTQTRGCHPRVHQEKTMLGSPPPIRMEDLLVLVPSDKHGLHLQVHPGPICCARYSGFCRKRAYADEEKGASPPAHFLDTYRTDSRMFPTTPENAPRSSDAYRRGIRGDFESLPSRHVAIVRGIGGTDASPGAVSPQTLPRLQPPRGVLWAAG